MPDAIVPQIWSTSVLDPKRRNCRRLQPRCPNLLLRILSEPMEVHFTAETKKKLKDLAALSGQATDDIVEDATVAYIQKLNQLRQTLDSRYDDLESGLVKPIDGEQFFESLRQREQDMLEQHSPNER